MQSIFEMNSSTDIEKGIQFFNEGCYFEAHEEWEKYWRNLTDSDEKLFIQGMIKISVALYHFKKKNFAGSEKLLKSGINLLTEHIDAKINIDKNAFIESINLFYKRLKYSEEILENELPKIVTT
jgi:predicted metal-dependent hydrolase